MNKKLLTAAIAAAIAAPTAALANDVTIYGVVHASVDYLDGGDASRSRYVWTPNGDYLLDQSSYLSTWGDNTDGFDVASRATRLGFKGTEDLANGLKAIWKMEFQVDIADRGGVCYSSVVPGRGLSVDYLGSVGAPTLNQGKLNGKCDDSDLITARNAYIGLAGGWGTFLVGRHDTPYKLTTQKLDLFADTLADNNSTIGFVDLRTNSAIAYISPAWYGLSFAGAVVAPHVYDSRVYNLDGELIKKSADADGLAEAYSLALTWDGYYGLFATAGYENVSGNWFDAWTGAYSGSSDVVPSGSNDNEKIRVGLGWTGGMMGWGGLTLGGIYEWEDNILGGTADGERWQLSAGFTFGNNMIKAMYGEGDYEFSNTFVAEGPVDGNYYGRISDEGNREAWAIGFDHNFSKRTKVYALYTSVNADYESREFVFDEAGQIAGVREKDDYETGGFSIGMVHSF